MVYANAGARFTARLIDMVICWLLVSLIATLHIPLSESGQPNWQHITIVIIELVFPFLYFTVFTAGAWQATPGKKIMKLRVIAMHAESVKPGRALAREVCFSLICIAISAIYAAAIWLFMDKGILLEPGQTITGGSETDGFLFFVSIAPITACLFAWQIARHKEHAGLHDRLAGTRVIRSSYSGLGQ